MLNYIASFHSVERVVERCRVNRDTAERNIKLAKKKGKNSNCFKSLEKKFLCAQEAKYGNQAIVYNGFCYMFAINDVCVTVLQLPNWFNKKRYFYNKERVRNVKKFMRNMYNDDLHALVLDEV